MVVGVEMNVDVVVEAVLVAVVAEAEMVAEWW